MTEEASSPKSPPPPPEHPSDGDRISITGVHGTAAHFEMAYTPDAGERLFFGPKLSARIPGFLFLAFAVGLMALEAIAYSGSSNSRLYVWLVEGDRYRPMPSMVLAIIILMSALGTVLRTHLRGVVVRAEGLEARYLVAFGLPRIRTWAWAQVHRVVMDEKQVLLELWDGSYQKLPPVAETTKMQGTLARVCAGRKIPVTRLGAIPTGAPA